MGGGIDLTNPDKEYNGVLNSGGTATVQTDKKPKYIIMGGSASTTTTVLQLSVYDVEKDVYYGTYTVNGGFSPSLNYITISNITLKRSIFSFISFQSF